MHESKWIEIPLFAALKTFHLITHYCIYAHFYTIILETFACYVCVSWVNRQLYIGGELWAVTQIIGVQLISFIIKWHCGFETLIILSIHHLNWRSLNNSTPQNYIICYLPCTGQKMDPFLSQRRLLSKETTFSPWYHYLKEKKKTLSFTTRTNWHLYIKNAHFLFKNL